MLPYDTRPWARTVAKTVIISSTMVLIGLGLYLHHIGQMRISEYVGLVILFLTIVPPNIAILYRKRNASTDRSQQAILH